MTKIVVKKAPNFINEFKCKKIKYWKINIKKYINAYHNPKL